MLEEQYLTGQQGDGGSMLIAYSVEVETIEDAEDLFVDAKDRMLDINNWTKYSGSNAFSLKLTDSHGHDVSRHARRGDHVFASNSGPGMEEESDWLFVSALQYDDYPDDNLETFAIKLMLTELPKGDEAFNDPADDPVTSIVVERNRLNVRATLMPATDHHAHDTVIAVMPDSEWQLLMKGLIEYFGE